MAVYLQATIEVRAGGLPRMCEAMAKLVVLLEAEGWRLEGAFIQRTGKLRTIIDIWRLDSFDHFDRGMKAIANKPGAAEIKAALDDTILSEALVFMDAAPFMHAAP